MVRISLGGCAKGNVQRDSVMQSISLDLRDVDKIDILKQGRPLPPAPGRRPQNQTKRAAYQSALNLWGMFNPGAAFYRYPADVAESPPHIHVLPPTSVPIGFSPAAGSAATIGVGLGMAAYMALGYSVSCGVYGSTTREFGVFYGGSLGLWTDAGVSGGPQYTFVFGGPGAFAGVSWGVGCDVDVGPFGVGAMLLFTLPPIRLMGYSVAFSVGTPSLPASVTVQVGITTTKPLLVIR